MLKSDSVYTQAKMTNEFKVMSLNVFSLLPHTDELRILVADENPHVIRINETKIASVIDDSHSCR